MGKRLSRHHPVTILPSLVAIDVVVVEKLVCRVISGHDNLWARAQQGNYYLAKFGDHRHCVSGYIMILVCHVTSQDHLIKGSCEFMGRSPSR